jgi:hypothetical protein
MGRDGDQNGDHARPASLVTYRVPAASSWLREKVDRLEPQVAATEAETAETVAAVDRRRLGLFCRPRWRPAAWRRSSSE